MFPEGTRGIPGKMGAFKIGAAKFAIQLNVPILPALVVGSHKAWPKDKIFIRPTPIQIHILDPIFPEQFMQQYVLGETREDNLDQAAKNMTTELENTIREKERAFYG